jgi:predicted NBD/HSP70 family sugar kinase
MGAGGSVEQQAAAVSELLIVEPAIKAPLDPGFAPVVLAKREYRKAAKDCTETVYFALPRADGCARGELKAFPETDVRFQATVILAGVMIQETIWRCGALSLQLAGPAKACEALKAAYSAGGTYAFEAETMPKTAGTPGATFDVKIVGSAGELPESKDTPQECGKDASGCRLAFDLGKSDIKTVAIKDGEVLDSMETEWDVTATDPQYHFDAIVKAMRGTIERAKAKGFGDIQAVGGSATGTVSGDNEATWCDIFPNVPPDVYKEKVVDIFKRIAKEVAGDVPLKVINDGEVTALAAVQKISKGNVMGISMGSSEGGGYANADGNLMGWINELCYIKLDMNPRAPTDPWTKGAHRGVSHMYLGQRGATKNAHKICEVPENMKYPHPDMCTIKHENHAQCLKLIQKAMADTPDKASDLYTTCGVYLGYGLAQYCEFYKIDHVMILGRVSKGAGGDLMLKVAGEVLEKEFPELPKITFHTADDHFKAVGQCIAAAALPVIK